MSYPKIGVRVCALCAIALLGVTAKEVEAHNGGIIVQSIGDQLVTGFDDESSGGQTIGDRAFTLLFGPSLAHDVPSFLSFASAPAGSDPLPGGSELFWDFLPMTHNGLTSNLLYWDGVGTMEEDVEFGMLPQNDITMSLYTEFFTNHADVTGDPEMVPGFKVGTVATSGSNLRLHAHRWWFLDSETSVPEGVYLTSLQIRVLGFKATDPFYVVMSTDSDALDVALPWLESQVDSLVLEGDYNFDGMVGGTDFLAWQSQFGVEQVYPTGPPFPANGTYPDGDGDGTVGDGDLSVWAQNLGGPPPLLASFAAPVPEPSTAALIASAIGTLFSCRLRKRYA